MAKKKKSKVKRLDLSIEDYLKPLEEPMVKELSYMEKNDWTTINNRKSRGDELNFHTLIIDKHLRDATALYKKASKDLTHPRLEKAFNTYFNMFRLFSNRYYSYIKEEDWTTYSEKMSREEKEAEMKIQIAARTSVINFGERMREINFGDKIDSINIPTYDDTPIPFMMREIAEERWPEIIDYIEKRKQEENEL